MKILQMWTFFGKYYLATATLAALIAWSPLTVHAQSSEPTSALKQAAEAFQRDADIVRLNHLRQYGAMIELYRHKTGHYPFEGKSDLPIYIFVAHDQQIEFTKPGPAEPHTTIPFAEFVSELEEGLGRSIDEFYDPQFRPVNKPNFYIYLIRRDTYYFAVHVHQAFPFARRIAEGYYKVEISNRPSRRHGLLAPRKLFSSPEFNTAIQAQIARPGLFRQREEHYFQYTKSLGR